MLKATRPVYVVDAFTSVPFGGNPAGVVVMEGALTSAEGERWMQAVAAEMRHAETAFVWEKRAGRYGLRWFTPNREVDLCGHATLATAWVLWESGRCGEGRIVFETLSGELLCERRGGGVEMDFPALLVEGLDAAPVGLLEALGLGGDQVKFVGRSRFDLLVEVGSTEVVQGLVPEMGLLEKIETRGVIVAAAGGGEGVDVTSRFFAPRYAVPEDPVTGSAHCVIGPYFSGKLGRERLVCYQASERGGTVTTRVMGERVMLGGEAVVVLEGRVVGWE